jgi:hypothetical protein
MSGLVPYAVPLDALRGFFGSMNVPEVERIKSLHKQAIADNAELFRFITDKGGPSLANALDQLCAGQVRKPEFASQYVSACELLCAHFGQKLGNTQTEEVDVKWLASELGPVFRGWGLGTLIEPRAIWDGVAPLPLPPSGMDPTVGTVTPDEVEQILMTLQSASIPRVHASLVLIIGELRSWFEAAGARRAALVTFHY